MRRLLHISDIHFGPKFVTRLGDAVLDLIERRRPDLVVISGDLTQRAKKDQFQAAREWVDRIPVPTLAIPGNHDVPAYRVHERLFTPYGVYRKYFAEEMEPVFEDDELLVIGVNTAFNRTVRDGQFTVKSLRRVDELLSAASPDKCRIVVAHHHLTPPPRFDTQRVTWRAREAVRLFAHHGVEMVLSGHLHQTYLASTEEYYPSGSDPTWLIHSGTTTSSRGRGWEKGRNSCNWIEIEDDLLTVHHLLWNERQEAFLEWRRHILPRRTGEGFNLVDRLDDAVS